MGICGGFPAAGARNSNDVICLNIDKYRRVISKLSMQEKNNYYLQNKEQHILYTEIKC